MATDYQVLTTDELPTGRMKSISVNGKTIALLHSGDEYFAVDDRCTHEECSLGTEGFLDEGILTCGCHGAQFDPATGDVLALPATQPIQTYPVKIVGKNVIVTF